MIVYPGTKINLGLYVHARRSDGYHNLETCFYPTAFSDVLELLPAKAENLVYSGLHIDVDAAQNLCTRALRRMQQLIPELPPQYLHLHKLVPTGAGLGGGSADAAAVLKTLATKYGSSTELNIENEALKLGSDCPFFVHKRPLFASGRGEIFSPASVDLSGYGLLLILPGIHVSTKMAFGSLAYKEVPQDWQQMLQNPVNTWAYLGLRNDFEEGIFAMHPVLAQYKQALTNSGALYAAMSGSGSTLFGIYPPGSNRPALTWPSAAETHWSTL